LIALFVATVFVIVLTASSAGPLTPTAHAGQTCSVDNDHDGWCAPGGGTGQADCDDNDGTVHPGAQEVFNQKDDDCDTITDEGFTDADGDLYAAPPGGSDCDDSKANVHPGAQEVMDAQDLDEDCDGLADCADTSRAGEADADDDGFLECGDCDDNNQATYPGAQEIYDGQDNDCDTVVDEGLVDGDGDGYAAMAGGGDDCNDENDAIHPGALDVPGDTIDQDCDSADAELPDTKITSGPSGKTTKRRPTFKFKGVQTTYPIGHLECSIDGDFEPCESPLKLKRLSLGKHTFMAKAFDEHGYEDGSPAVSKFKVVRG
jgi:hypothetical protein